jgi:hypothetical protein
VFNNDSTIASAVLDRLLHHAETVVIEGARNFAPPRPEFQTGGFPPVSRRRPQPKV